jgi:hypothetical protein
MLLEGHEIVERMDLIEFAGVDEAHVNVADSVSVIILQKLALRGEADEDLVDGLGHNADQTGWRQEPVEFGLEALGTEADIGRYGDVRHEKIRDNLCVYYLCRRGFTAGIQLWLDSTH